MYHFIVNPKSSSGNGKRIWSMIQHQLKSNQIEYAVYFTKKTNHAMRLATLISTTKQPCTIVAVGGDGTANEVINGVKNYDSIIFGYIPTGSSNDLARGLGLPSNPQQALAAILSPKSIEKISVGISQCGSDMKNFLVSTGIGFDAAVCNESLHSTIKPILNRFGLGKLTYTGIALKMLFVLKPSSMELVMDGKRKHFYQKAYFITAMNLKYEGGGFMFCPKADPGDQMLDICVVEKMSKLKVLFLLPTAFFGKHINVKGVHIFRCHKAIIKTMTPLPIHTDGEIMGFKSEIMVTSEKKQLSFILG